MTSLFDQYEQVSVKTKSNLNPVQLVRLLVFIIFYLNFDDNIINYALILFIVRVTHILYIQSNLGYINITMDQETPIFTKSKKDFTPSDKITHAAISNKYLVVVMANNILFRMNLQNPTENSGKYKYSNTHIHSKLLLICVLFAEITLTKYTQNKLGNLFLDPTGNHLLLTFIPKNPKVDSPEFMYLSRKSDKLKSTTKVRKYLIHIT